ncbi:MAG TPA: hypothetical protein VNG51_02035 [Ktedonobacteraceae bacterium]|nr:hypothetical protein [Ktedonobacteraceae bacterium]
MPCRFVLQLPPYLAKVAVTDCLSKTVVFEHTCHMQVLNRYQDVVFDQVGCELVGCIFADMRNSGMVCCEQLTGLCAVLAAFFTARFLPF